MKEAKSALENANLEKASLLFEKIRDLCIDLGDDSLGGEFNEKSLKIKEMLKKASIQEVSISTEKEILPKPIITSEQPISLEKPVPLEKPPEIEQQAPIEQPKPIVKPLLPGSPAGKPKVKPLPQSKPAIKPTVESIQKVPGVPQTKIPLKEPEPSKTPVIVKKETKESEYVIKPTITQKGLSLKLNPEDFMIKQRPKSIGDIPKDAKNKLTTTPYGQVTNEPQYETQEPSSSTELNPTQPSVSPQPKQPTSPAIPQVPKPIIPSTTSQPLERSPSIEPQKKAKLTVPLEPAPKPKPTSTPTTVISTPTTVQQKANLEQSLMDLKIQKANLSKMMLDLDMKELTGEMSLEEANEKKKKLVAIEDKINQQIQDMQKLLNV